LQLFPNNGKQGPAALTKIKNTKSKNIFPPKQGHPKNLKTCLGHYLGRDLCIYACQQNSIPSRDPVPLNTRHYSLKDTDADRA